MTVNSNTDTDQSLFNRRLVFVLGKGGVGKTTLAAALGQAGRQLKRDVLLIEIGESGGLGTFFDHPYLPESPVELEPGLWAVRLNPQTILKEYIYTQIGLSFLTKAITHSKLFEHLGQATPGLKEVITLGQIWRFETGHDVRSPTSFNFIVVDAPATGHGLSLLSAIQRLADMVRIGPIHKQAVDVLSLLRDPAKTALVTATLPEELPANETIELQRIARDELKMQIAATVINATHSQPFTGEECAQIKDAHQNLALHADNPHLAMLIDAGHRLTIREETQQGHIKRLVSEATGRIVKLPFFFTRKLVRDHIEQIADRLLTHLHRSPHHPAPNHA